MAQTESQLEIYKIILGRKTVRQIIREKAEADEITINTDIEYSNYLFRKLLNKLTEEGLVEIDLDNIKLTNKGLDLANLVWEEFV